MKSVILIFTEYPDLSGSLRNYEKWGKVNSEEDARLVIEGKNGWFAISFDPNIECEYSDSELEKIKERAPSPVFVQLEFNNYDASNYAVSNLLVNSDIWIDNTHGMIRPIQDILERIRSGMDWQTSPGKGLL